MGEQPSEDALENTGRGVKAVTRKDLPLSCPMPDMEVWNMHPKVYLPIEKTGKAVCPYCGAGYELVDS